MNESEIKANFLKGHCDRIKDYVSKKECVSLYEKMNKRLNGARCKCRHKGIRNSSLKALDKLIKPQ